MSVFRLDCLLVMCVLGLEFDWKWVEFGIAAHVVCACFAAILDGIWGLELCASRQLC